MFTKSKSITLRVAEAVDTGSASVVDLLALQEELSKRCGEVQSAIDSAKKDYYSLIAAGDTEKLSANKKSVEDMEDTRRVIWAQGDALRKELKVAKARETMASVPRYRKQLATALQDARKALVTIAECQRVVEELMAARVIAESVGQNILFDADSIQSLVLAIYPEGSERKQIMIDLGLPEARRSIYLEPTDPAKDLYLRPGVR